MQELQINLPNNLANMTLPEPELVTYYRNLENRTFWIDFDIDTSLLEISKAILYFNYLDKNIEIKNRSKIIINVFSYGGELDACYNLLSICEISKTPIITINMGVAMSAGLLILLAGHERYCINRSQAMIHSGSAGLQGTYEQIEESQKSYKKAVDEMRNYILERTKIDVKLFNKNKSKDWYLSAIEQVELGIVQRIITDINEIV